MPVNLSPGHQQRSGLFDPVEPDPLQGQDPWSAGQEVARASSSPTGSGREPPRKFFDYKLDPAPSWGGENPEKQYREFHRNLQLWLIEADARLPMNLIGKRMIDSIPIGSKLGAMLAHLSIEEICSDQGHRIILKLIEDSHEFLKDQRLEQAFDDAIFRGRRERGQSLTTFLTGKKAAFAELKKQGLDLLTSTAGRHLLGHLILRQGAFTQDQRQRLKVVTNGSIDYKEIEKAVQKIFGDRLDEQHVEQHHTPRRWRSNTFWEGDDGIEDEDMDFDPDTFATDPYEDDGILDNLICLNESEEVQMIFAYELPAVMEESEALEMMGLQMEDVFFEAHRHVHKGKGKGKKGKGKNHSKTFGMGTPGHGKGGYMEHRRMLQATRNGRGFDKPSSPWHQRSGSRLSLAELKAKSRCHQCRQIGHWSKECPQRKPLSPPPRSSAGFFMEPPKLAESGHFFETSEQLEYMPCSFVGGSGFSGLSFVFLGTNGADGTALVDTAAQHGLVGLETLQAHDRLLQERFGLKVQWSTEAGGSVRGVCGKEEKTHIVYVPIGLSGKSGVLRCQVVPGDIPFLLPAYFLSDLGAIIDMKNCMIMYMSLGCKQTMHRLHTGHVAVSIIEFGDGYNVPVDFPQTRSSAWSREPLPWTGTTPSLGRNAPAMAPLLATLVAAAGRTSCRRSEHHSSGRHDNFKPDENAWSRKPCRSPRKNSPSWLRQQLHPARCHKDPFTIIWTKIEYAPGHV